MSDTPNDVSSIRSRLMAMVPADQSPFADFELRMLTATLEAEHLRDIHTHWRPIADERNQLRIQLAAAPVASAEPLESRRAARNKNEALQLQYDKLLKKQMDLEDTLKSLESGDDGPRIKALTVELQNLQTNHTGLRDRHQKLHEDYSELEAKYKQLQVDCGESEPS